jgi:hypothetical protein
MRLGLSAPPSCCVVCHPIALHCILRPTPLVRPLVLLFHRLVIAYHIASVAGVFAIVAPALFTTKRFETQNHTILFLYQKPQDNHPEKDTYMNSVPCHILKTESILLRPTIFGTSTVFL